MIAAPAWEGHAGDRGVDGRRLDHLRDHVRSALRMGRMVLDEVLDHRFEHDDPEGYRKLVAKAGGELAMLLRLARRALLDERDAEEIRALARALAPLVRSAEVHRTLVMRPSRAAMYALSHFCLAELGVADERLDRVARLALGSSVRAANERVPYRLLDAAWTRHLAFGDAELDHPAIGLSPLGAGVDLLEATAEDAYAFTHALPYATDFGRIALPAGLDRSMLLGIAEALAVKALDEDDLDLLAEVLMAPAILRVAWTPILAFGWRVLERVWREFGFVPGPGLPPAVPDETRAQAVRRVLGTTYHTTFAAGLCCATLVSCGAAPPDRDGNGNGNDDCDGDGDAGPSGGGDAPPGKGAAWKVNWHGCSRRAQAELSLLGLGFALRRAVESSDLVRVREVVMSAAGRGLVEHPLVLQALELLERASA